MKSKIWKRRYTAEIPDPLAWDMIDYRGDWLLYRAKELVEGWRNYRLIHRRPAKMRVSYRIAFSPSECRCSNGRDHKELFFNHGDLLLWVVGIASSEPDQVAMDSDNSASLQA